MARLTLAATALAVMISAAWAHGPAQWVNDGQYKNAMGELCCGARDCFELASDDIAVTAAGYFINR